MKNKIIIFVLFIGLLINPILCETFQDSFIHTGSSSESYTTSLLGSGSATPQNFNRLHINNIEVMKNIEFITYHANASYFSGSKISEYNSISFTIDGNPVGSGLYGYHKNPSETHVWIHLWIQELNTTGLSGTKDLMFIGNNINVRFGNPTKTSQMGNQPSGDTKVCFATSSFSNPTVDYYTDPGEYTVDTDYYIEFPFNYTNDYDINRMIMNRSTNKKSIVKVTTNSFIIYNETSLQTSQFDFINENSTWIILNEDEFGSTQTKTISFYADDETPTLTTDKTYYNTSELIEISYTNIDNLYENNKIKHLYQKPYELYILYPVIDDYKQYKAKFIQPLYYDLRDEIFILNTSFLSPQNVYTLGIVGINGDYTQHEDILIFSDSFVVYPDDEYLSLSCESETGCTTGNKDKITIYYKINNNSEIIIKDNDGNIINTYYNIINEGEIVYTIPEDIEHLNTYPNWKIYLNNTDYSTSFNKSVTVYWSLFTIPTPIPTFTPQPTLDINISDEIDNLKDEISPIKDLIIGLSGILIDNPDYNKDNIVDENEINHWFNSLIPMCILFLLLVLYIGLKKQRE